MLSDEERRRIEDRLPAGLPKRAGLLEALHAVQASRGWVDDDAVADVAALLEMTPAEVDAVATGYCLIYRRPVGRHVILLCDSLSCWTTGYNGVRERIERALGIGMGETTPDGRFTLLPVACLGACDRAPAMMIDEDLHGPVSPEAVGEILEQYE